MISNKSKVKEFKRFHEKSKINLGFLSIIYISIIVLLIISVLTKFSISFILFLGLLGLIINYHTNMLTIRIVLGIEVFFSLLVTKLYGIPAGFFVLALTSFIPDIYTARFDKDTILSLFFTSIMILVMKFLGSTNFVFLGLTLVVLKFIIGIVILVIFEMDPREIIFEWGTNFAVNLFLFISFGAPLISYFS